MAANASGQSQGKKKTKEKQPMKIYYDLLNLRMNQAEQKATCQLMMPAKLPAFYNPPLGANPSVVLDVKHPTQDIHSVTLMRDCLHKNLLHARLVSEKDSYLLVFTDQYTGMLLAYCKSSEPFVAKYAEPGEIYPFPSAKLQSVVTQMLDGLKGLWLYGKYHGNLRLDNTYYHKTKDCDVVVKLASFKCQGTKLKDPAKKEKDKTETVAHYQAKDLQAVGIALNEISQMASDLSEQGYLLDCSQIDHLAERLKEVSKGEMHYVMDEIRTYPFFWTRVERKEFFVSQVPLAMLSNSVKAKIEAEQDLCTLPWNNDDYNGFLALMIKYQDRNNMRAYDFNSRVCYVQFISGIYTHEVELKNPVASADDTVNSRNHGVFLVLYSLLPRPPRPVNQG